MAIITKGTVTKGETAQFTLNKTELAALIPDSYYSNISNWSRVVIKYKSSTGNQSLTVTFNAAQATPVGDFFASATALDNFEIISIQIFDYDNGNYKLNRTNFNVAEFDLSLGGGVEPVSGVFSETFKASDITLTNSNLTATRTNSSSGTYVAGFTDSEYLIADAQKLFFEVNVDSIVNSGVEAFGIAFQTGTPTLFASASVTMPGFFGAEGPRIIQQGAAVYKQAQTGSPVLLGNVGNMTVGTKVGVAIDLGLSTVKFFNNGVWSSDFDFSDIISGADRIYFGVGPHAIGDAFTKSTESVNTPVGYTLI